MGKCVDEKEEWSRHSKGPHPNDQHELSPTDM